MSNESRLIKACSECNSWRVRKVKKLGNWKCDTCGHIGAPIIKKAKKGFMDQPVSKVWSNMVRKNG